MKWWDWMLWSSFFECWVSSQFFSLSSFTLIKRFFRSSLLSAIRVVSSAYPRLLFLPAICISAYNSSNLAFHRLYLAQKFNKQEKQYRALSFPFPILNQSVVPCLLLTVASWPAYRFLRRQVRWSNIPIFLRIFCSVLLSTQSKALV